MERLEVADAGGVDAATLLGIENGTDRHHAGASLAWHRQQIVKFLMPKNAKRQILNVENPGFWPNRQILNARNPRF
jgi:hypothetical protein